MKYTIVLRVISIENSLLDIPFDVLEVDERKSVENYLKSNFFKYKIDKYLKVNKLELLKILVNEVLNG